MDVYLLAVVLKDHFAGKRYPWTHWVGIGLDWWNGAVWLAWSICFWIRGPGMFS